MTRDDLVDTTEMDEAAAALDVMIQALGALRASRKYLVLLAATLEGKFDGDGLPLDEAGRLRSIAAGIVDEMRPLHALLQDATEAGPDPSYMSPEHLREVLAHSSVPGTNIKSGFFI